MKFKNKKINFKKISKIIVFVLTAIFTIIAIVLLSKTLFQVVSNVNINSDVVQNVYNSILNIKTGDTTSLAMYQDEEMNVNTMSIEDKLPLAYNYSGSEDKKVVKLNKDSTSNNCKVGGEDAFKLDKDSNDGCTVESYSGIKVQNNYKILFGKDLEDYNLFDFRIDNTTGCSYDSNEKNYYCGNSIVTVSKVGWSPTNYRAIYKASKTLKKLVIYDYLLTINDNSCYSFNSSEKINDECTNSIDIQNITTEDIFKYGTMYEHTFKKGSNNTYYWISSKPII